MANGAAAKNLEPERTYTPLEAALDLCIDESTARRAARVGLVEGAHKDETRWGVIHAPWVATGAAWQKWFDNRPKVGRPARWQPKLGLLSRADSALITRAQWVPDPKTPNMYWWHVWTDKTGDSPLSYVGIHHVGGAPSEPPSECRFLQGTTITLGDMSFVPAATGLMAYSESEKGPVLATIGRARDQLEPYCGPLVYLVQHCHTRDDTADPSEAQVSVLEEAVSVLMQRGVKAAKEFLQQSGLFSAVFEGIEGCPNPLGKLPEGVWEWR